MLSENIFEDDKESFLEKTFNRLGIIYRNKIDRYIIFPKQRWAATGVLLLLYLLRISQTGGFYVVSYVLGLYLLHQTVQFYTPLGLPDSQEEDDEEDGSGENENAHLVGSLPTFVNQGEEDQGPLIRSMSEFRFWQNCTLTTVCAILCTVSDVFDLPVFWPFLLAYFALLFVLTVKRHFKHMKKWNYKPSDFTRKSNK